MSLITGSHYCNWEIKVWGIQESYWLLQLSYKLQFSVPHLMLYQRQALKVTSAVQLSTLGSCALCTDYTQSTLVSVWCPHRHGASRRGSSDTAGFWTLAACIFHLPHTLSTYYPPIISCRCGVCEAGQVAVWGTKVKHLSARLLHPEANQ